MSDKFRQAFHRLLLCRFAKGVYEMEKKKRKFVKSQNYRQNGERRENFFLNEVQHEEKLAQNNTSNHNNINNNVIPVIIIGNVNNNNNNSISSGPLPNAVVSSDPQGPLKLLPKCDDDDEI